MAQIDSLEIVISSSPEETVNKLNNIAKALRGIKSASEGNVGNGLRESIRTINELNGEKVNALADALGKLKGISIGSKLAENVKAFSDAVSKIDDPTISRIERVTTALSKLQGVNLTGFSASTRSIGNTTGANIFKDMTVDQALALSETDLLKAKIEALKASLRQKMDAGVIDDKGIATAIAQIQKLIDKYNSLTAAKEETAAAGGSTGGLQDKTGGTIGGGASSVPAFTGNQGWASEMMTNLKAISQEILSNVRPAFDSLKETAVSTFAEINDAASKMNWTTSWQKNISQIKSYWSSVGTAITSSVAPGISIVVSLLGKAVSSAWNLAKTVASISFNALKTAITSAWNAMKKLVSATASFVANRSGINSITNALKKVKSIISSITRVAFYRVIRSAIKAVTDTLNEGAENAYWYSKKIGDATKYISEAYDSLSSSSYTMGNQLGAAWTTLVATIEPILTQIIEMIQRAVEVITEFFAILSGKSTYLKATSYVKNWKDETEDAADAADEWKNQLMGFDEINKLTDNSSSSGSGSDSGTDYGSMFEEVEIESWLKDLLSSLESGDWATLGKTLAEKLNSLTDNFDWTGLGTKIGKFLQNAIDFAYNFLKGYDFQNLGYKIASLLDSLGDQINFNTLGRLMIRIRTALWDVIYGAFEYLSEGDNAKKLAERLSDILLGAMQELIEWIDSMSPEKIATAIKNFFSGIKTNELKETFVTLIQKAWTFAVTLKEELFPDGLVKTVTTNIVEFFKKIPWEDIRDAIKEGLVLVKDMFIEILDIIWPPESRMDFVSKLKEMFKNLVSTAISSVDWAAVHNVFAYILDVIVFGKEKADRMWYNKGEFAGRDIIIGVEEGIKMQKADLDATMQGYILDPVSQALYEAEQNSATTGSKIVSEIEGGIIASESDLRRVLGINLKTPIEEALQALVDSGEMTESEMADILKAIKKDTKSTSSEVKSNLKDAKSSTKDISTNAESTSKKVTRSTKTIKSDLDTSASNVDKWEESATGSIETVRKKFSEETKDMKKGMGEAESESKKFKANVNNSMASVATAASNMSKRFSTYMRNMSSSANSAANSIVKSMNRIVSACNKAASAQSKVTSSSSGSSSSKNSSSVNGYATGGFPEDGLFFANHTELVGKFSNGRTAVANNDQITAGIADACYDAFMTAFSQTGGTGKSGGTVVFNVNGREFARATYSDYKAVEKEKGISMINNFA